MKKNERRKLDGGDRMVFAIVGVVAILYGYGQILRHKPVYTTWLGQDSTAGMPILLGTVLLLVAILPWGRIHTFWNSRKGRN
jgi:hypothetical protein